MKPCMRCKGSGKSSFKDNPCPFCNGRGDFPEVKINEIVGTVYNLGHRRAHGKLKVAFPATLRRNLGLIGQRSYYVWRLARFHGGVDVRMPITAEILCDGDPYREELHSIAENIAKLEFGTDMGAVEAWKGKLF